MHSNDKPLRYREILNKVQKFGVQEERRKGVTRILFHTNINGKYAFTTMHIHNESQIFSRAVVRSIRDRFNISLKDFYDA